MKPTSCPYQRYLLCFILSRPCHKKELNSSQDRPDRNMKIHTIHRHHSYLLGEVAHSYDMDVSYSMTDAEVAVFLFHPGDSAFVCLEGIWRYAVVLDVAHNDHPSVTFMIGPDGSTTQIDRAHWTDEVRPISDRKRHKHFFKRYARIDPLCHYTHHRHYTHHPFAELTFQDRQESCLRHLQMAGCLHNPFAVHH